MKISDLKAASELSSRLEYVREITRVLRHPSDTRSLAIQVSDGRKFDLPSTLRTSAIQALSVCAEEEIRRINEALVELGVIP